MLVEQKITYLNRRSENNMKEQLMKRFIRYVKIGTQSNPNEAACPSSEGQWELAKLLEQELIELGLEEVTLDDNCYVMATLPSNTAKQTDVIGFVAHMDTATEISGDHVKPQVVENYDGGDIVLNKEANVVLSPKQFPELTKYKGQTLITTDGTTLLGADDKAGIAEIMQALAYLQANPSIEHGTIKICFTPDEEIGRGANLFDVKAFGADYAYTMDGGPLGELQYENFNAATLKVTCYGRSVHPGSAKDKMINATRLALAYQQAFDENDTPEHSAGYEGFFHLNSIKGHVEQCDLMYLIRDFDQESFEKRKAFAVEVGKKVEQQYGEGLVKVEVIDSYYNMHNKIKPVMHIVERAADAMKAVGLEPRIEPIRGGTDGARLSYMGLPTPNIFAGGENFHGKYEYIAVESMIKAVEVIVEIARAK